MSFQDFSSSGRNRGAAAPSSGGSNYRSGATGGTRANIPMAPSSGGGGGSIGSNSGKSSGAAGILNQISESLSQYQRHVGILEKIVQSLATTSTGSLRRTLTTPEELDLQYQAQVDVIGQLEDKVRRLLKQQEQNASSPAITGPVVKLKRDFESVQARARVLQSGVERLKREQKAALDAQQKLADSSAAGASGDNHAGNGGGANDLDHFEQMQLQLQHDRLAEEIMREREEEIRNINRGMHQVNEIYRDLANIVSAQQEQVDVIETQMEESRVNAESGLEQVQKANEKYGSSQCIIS